jgi:hypothetical protein
MPITLPRSAPADLAAGFMHVRYLQSGKLSNIQRIHLNTVLAANVAAEFEALADILKLFYSSDWKIQLSSLWQVSGTAINRLSTPTDPATGAFYEKDGTSVASASPAEGFLQTIISFDTVNGHKARIQLVGTTGAVVEPDSEVNPDAAGFPDQKLVNYLVNTTTRIVAHDNSKFKLPARETTTFKQNLRRDSMRV